MPNEENLKNGVATQFKSGEEAVRAGRAGGIASGKSKREKGNLRALAQLWLETEVMKDKNGEPMTGGQFMLAVAAKEIAKGNSKFWELMRDTAGQKPVDKVMIADVDPAVIEDIERIVADCDDATLEDNGPPGVR